LPCSSLGGIDLPRCTALACFLTKLQTFRDYKFSANSIIFSPQPALRTLSSSRGDILRSGPGGASSREIRSAHVGDLHVENLLHRFLDLRLVALEETSKTTVPWTSFTPKPFP
jgi:hypothetical protein